MNCKEYRELIEDALDISLQGDPEKRVRLHLEHCDACRSYFDRRRAEHVALFTGINAAYSDLHLPEGFANRLVASVHAHRVDCRVWRYFKLPKWVLIAASIVAMVGISFAAKVVVDGMRGTVALNSTSTQQGETSMNKAKVAATSFTATLLVGITPMSSGAVTTNLADSVEISADTNITVAANEILKIEYVYGDNPVTVTKSGGGRLEIATSSISNLSVVVAEGTFASARPAAIPLNDTFRPSLRVDASDTTKFTYSESDGTNFLSKVMDADGNGAYFSNWGGWGRPYVAFETLNGLGLIDFGTIKDMNSSNSPRLASGHGGMLAFNNIGPEGKSSLPLGEFFFVWKDRDDSIDHELINGNEFSGPPFLGNNPSWFIRGNGGGGNGFSFYSGMPDAISKNIHLDGEAVRSDMRVPRGFHLIRNRIKEGSSVSAGMIGYTSGSSTAGKIWTAGGFVLAEAVIYSNRLSEATAMRVEAQLQSKWLGLKLKNLTLAKDATLDVGAFKFAIGTLDITGDANIIGITNLCFDALTRTSSNVLVSGAVALDGFRQHLTPDLAFDGDAEIAVSGTTRIQTVTSGTGILVKSGDGELRLADPAATNITVAFGTLAISPLYVRSAEYHLDASALDTMETTDVNGTNMVSAWYDMEDSTRAFKPTTWRTYDWNKALRVRGPYVSANAVGEMPMVDFGTFANANHQDGWGGCLEPVSSLSGIHEAFVVWKDHPEVKDYTYGSDYGTDFYGPCLFGLQYYWFRGTGGNGSSFAMHYSTAPGIMYGNGLVWIDGEEVDGRNSRIGDGIHVYSQRVSESGVPIQQMGGAWQADVKTSPSGASVKGTYGGLMVGEVILFKDFLSDRFRSRISGALNSKWRNATNEWAYGEISIAAGATLNHPYADLEVTNLLLGGSIAATRVMPSTLTLPGTAATLDGRLELPDGGQIVIGVNQDGSFGTLRAQSVRVKGSGTIAFHGNISTALCGRTFRIVETSDVDAPGMSWKAPSLRGTGLRAVLSAKADGLYLTFESSGFVVLFR